MEFVKAEEIKNLIVTALGDAQVVIDGGDGKYRARIISAAFNGLSSVQRHRTVYAALQDHIQSGRLHALSIEALTPQESQT